MNTVDFQYPPHPDEPIDAEVMPLCVALQRKGFPTYYSDGSHGSGWPYVAWKPHPQSMSLITHLLMRQHEGTSPGLHIWPQQVYQHEDSFWMLKVCLWGDSAEDACKTVAGWVDSWVQPA